MCGKEPPSMRMRKLIYIKSSSMHIRQSLSHPLLNIDCAETKGKKLGLWKGHYRTKSEPAKEKVRMIPGGEVVVVVVIRIIKN